MFTISDEFGASLKDVIRVEFCPIQAAFGTFPLVEVR